jgi:hypothetical protein
MGRVASMLLVMAFLVAGCQGSGLMGLDDNRPGAQWFEALPPSDDFEPRAFAGFELCDTSTDVLVEDGNRSRTERCAEDEETSGIRYTVLLRYAIEETEEPQTESRSDLGDVTEVHLHIGGEGWQPPSAYGDGVLGDEGPVVAVLYDSDGSSGWDMADHLDPWPISVLCPDCDQFLDSFEGFLSVANLRGPLTGWTLSELMQALCFGDPVLYIEVHSADDPHGGRRSQVAPPAMFRPLDETGTGGCAWYP